MAGAEQKPTVATQTGQLDAVRDNWPMLRALIGGTKDMRAAGKAFLPQWPQEDDKSYKIRLSTATLHPVFRHTCQVMASKPFSRPMTVKAAPDIEKLFDDIDMQGTPFTAYTMGLFLECLQAGMTGVLVEYPDAPGIKTRAEEIAAGLRPYLTTYQAESIIGWRMGKNGLELLRLLESVDEPDGEWGIKKVKQVRVLRPGAWETWREVQNKPGEWYLDKSGTNSLTDVIPFVFFYGVRLEYGVGQCPLLDLAFQNVEHYQSASDQQTILHVSRVPILFGKGFPDDANIVIGSSQAVLADRADADLQYVEHTGAAVEAGRQSLLDLEERMRATGADLLSQKPVQVTATQIKSEGDSGKSLLQSIAENFEESLELCLNFMARYVKSDPNAEVDLYKDFSKTPTSDPSTLTAAAKGGILSKQTSFEELKRRDVISPDREWKEEMARLKLEQEAMPKEEETE